MTAKNIFEPRDSFQRMTFAEDKQTIADSLIAIASQCSLKKINKKQEKKIQKSFSRFDSFKQYRQVFLFDSFELTKNANKSLLAIVSINSIVESIDEHQLNRENLTELEFVGLADLKKDYGRVYIRPETIADKLNELIDPIEIDFAFDKAFSRKYFVLTTDEHKLREQVTSNFLSVIRKYKGLEIEIDRSTLMVRLRKRISVKNARIITEFLTEINNGNN